MLAHTFGLGLSFKNTDAICSNQSGSAITAGEVYMVDHAQTTATTNKTNDAASNYATVVSAIAAADNYGIFCVALEDIAAGEKGRFRFRGQVRALVNANADRGDGLSILTTGQLDATPVANNGIVAIAEEGNAAGAGGKIWVLFNGIEKLGIETG